jgi:hypothetical protein
LSGQSRSAFAVPRGRENGGVNSEDRAPDAPSRDDRAPGDLASKLRWLGRLAVVALGLWFIVDGLREQWSAADAVATGLVVALVVLGLAFLVVGTLHLARRGRAG